MITLQHVTSFNRGKEGTIMAFTTGNGSMIDKLRVRGFVVSGYQGEDSHKFFMNESEAWDFIKSTGKEYCPF